MTENQMTTHQIEKKALIQESSHTKYSNKQIFILLVQAVILILMLIVIFTNRQKIQIMNETITIIHIWTGSDPIPKKYLNNLSAAKYSFILLQEPEWKIYTKRFYEQEKIDFNSLNQSRTSMKSDILRFLYLYYESGIYFDLDFQINDRCLNYLREVQKRDYDIMLGENQRNGQPLQTNPVFVKKKRSQNLLKLLKEAKWEVLNVVWRKYQITDVYLADYCHHTYDGLWRKDGWIGKQDWQLPGDPGYGGK